MQRMNRLFSETDRLAVNRAVQEAESGTSAEILPVVAASSGRYDRPEDIVGLWFALSGMVLVWTLYPLPQASHGSWASPSPIGQLAALAAAVVGGFVLGAFVGSRVDWLRRLFTPRRQMHEEVLSRARAVFFDNRVHHTKGSSGVLLYISLFERMAAVIADETVFRKLGQEKIDALCAELTHRLRSGNAAAALAESARSVGQSLTPLLPRAESDDNELPDALLLIE
jgi:putative membrane protein